MAAQKRKTTKSTANSRTKSRKSAPKKVKEESSFIRAEVGVLVSFALAVILFLSNFHLCGAFGDLLRSVQLGIFGFMGFLAPLIIFVGTAFYLSNRGNRTAMRKLAAVIVLVFVICGFAQLFFGVNTADGTGLLAVYRASSVNGSGGGFFGWLICYVLKTAIGTAGTFIVLALCFVVCAVCITERSFVQAVKQRSDRVYQYANDEMAMRREIREEKRAVLEEERAVRAQERRQQRMDRLRGVNLSSTDLSVDHMLDREIDPLVVPEPGIDLKPEPNVIPDLEVEREVLKPIVYREEESEPEEIPFEEDRVLSAAESAQRLVEEGLSQFQEIKIQRSDVAVPDMEKEPVSVEEPVGMREIPISGLHSEPEQGEGMIPKKIQSSGQYAPEDEEEDIYIFADSRTESAVSAESSAYIPPTAEDDPMADEVYTKQTTSGGVFEVSGGERRVETASGKIIDTDTEALQKKLESARKEAKAAKTDEDEAEVADEIREREEEPKKEYIFPPMGLLKKGNRSTGKHSQQEFRETAIKLEQTLRTFGVGVTVTNISCGPNVTRYELHPEMGVKVSKIVGLSDDIKLSLAAEDIRIEAPIPGKSAVGIEVPNKTQSMVYLRDLLEADHFQKHSSTLAFAVGKDIGGQVVVTDIAKMPHLLIAGQTGSGKSVCINTLIMSVIYKAKPEDVKLILIDPKVVELSIYNGIPHLLIPVVTDPKKAAGALNWAVAEMTDRYKKFAKYGVRDIKGYNARVEGIKDIDDPDKPKKLAKIVIVIDELADLMMVASGEVEDAICRLAQLARACGIHLVIATQRPSVNVITGLIKANVPSRIAFSVASSVDSRTILDMGGAEKLLGHGDMLFYPAGYPKPQRVQGAFVSDDEVQAVCDFLNDQGITAQFDAEVEKKMEAVPTGASSAGGGTDARSGRDEYFEEAGRFIIEKEKASIGMLQRMFKIGFNRAARIMDQLAEAGVVGEEEGTKPRKILMTMSDFEQFLSSRD